MPSLSLMEESMVRDMAEGEGFTPLEYRVANGIDTIWRFRRVANDGSLEPRPKITHDAAWIAAHGDTVDIANTPFDNKPSDWQMENLAAAQCAIAFVRKHHGRIDLRNLQMRLAGGNYIHNKWRTRHPEQANGPLGVKFSFLPDEEQEKDLDHLRIAQQIVYGRPGIVAGFPGVGKTYLAKSTTEALDADSSRFSWRADAGGQRVENKQFLYKCIGHVVRTFGEAALVQVSTHPLALKALGSLGLSYMIVYPDGSPKTKRAYLETFKARGDAPEFIEMMDRSWEDFINQCKAEKGPVHIQLEAGQYLSDVPVVRSYLPIAA